MDYINLSPITLAFLGDAVYELFIRERLVKGGKGGGHADLLHKEAARHVRARAQAEALKALEGALSGEELLLVRRARNHKSATRPKNADPMEYKCATAFEALLGFLFLSGQTERLNEIMRLSAEHTEGKR